MGIDTSGKMIVGAYFSDTELQKRMSGEELHDWVEDHGMEITSDYYDCGEDAWKIGFVVDSASMMDIDEEWRIDLKHKFEKFEALTGTQPTLMGTQDVW
jgi:hypothetical protein